MSLVNYSTREITCKIVYYGPGRSGKTTNLQYIHGSVPGERRGKLVSLATESDRTLFFDFLPLELGSISGFQTRMQLYTVPGQVYYDATRKLVLQGTDGVVFVADSHPEQAEQNLESFRNLHENLLTQGVDPRSVPLCLQYNKRDLRNPLPVHVLQDQLNYRELPSFEASALSGRGVLDTLRAVSAAVLHRLSERVHQPVAAE